MGIACQVATLLLFAFVVYVVSKSYATAPLVNLAHLGCVLRQHPGLLERLTCAQVACCADRLNGRYVDRLAGCGSDQNGCDANLETTSPPTTATTAVDTPAEHVNDDGDDNDRSENDDTPQQQDDRRRWWRSLLTKLKICTSRAHAFLICSRDASAQVFRRIRSRRRRSGCSQGYPSQPRTAVWRAPARC